MKNKYMLEYPEGGDYREVSRARANRAIENGKAHWAGSEVDSETGDIIHYADLGGED